MIGFDAPPVLRQIDARRWALERAVSFTGPSATVRVPAGFTTDLASVPRPLWPLISPWDVAAAAVVHDWLYAWIRAQSLTRRQRAALRAWADSLFLVAMAYSTVPPVATWRRVLAYLAVRLFGWATLRRPAQDTEVTHVAPQAEDHP